MLERLVLPLWLRLSLALPLLALNLWVLRQLLLPLAPFPALFLGAALIAFLLDLPTRWLVGRSLPRPWAVLLVLGLGLGLLVLAAFWLVPRLIEQLGELITALPSWLAEGERWLDRLEGWAAVEGGHVMADADATGWAPMVDSGKFRLLCIWTEARNARWPDVPTLKELGFDLTLDSPFGLAGPKGIDPAIVKKLHDAFLAALDDPKVVELMAKYDYPKRYMNSADYAAFARKQYEEQREVVEQLGLGRKS